MTTGRGVIRRWALVATLILGPATAAAQAEGGAEGTTTSTASADKEAEARTLAGQGAEAFKAGNYLDAVAAFQKAYALIPRPALAYNIARSHERLSQWEEAIEWYEKYLKLAGSLALAGFLTCKAGLLLHWQKIRCRLISSGKKRVIVCLIK